MGEEISFQDVNNDGETVTTEQFEGGNPEGFDPWAAGDFATFNPTGQLVNAPG